MKNFKTLFLLVILVALTVTGAQAKKIFVPEVNDPRDQSDDSLRTEALQWKEDESPLWVAIYRTNFGTILPESINDQDIEDADIYRALNRCLKRWNDADLGGLDMSFQFRDTAFYSDFLAGVNPALPSGPEEVAFDRYNLISFQEPNETLPTGVIYADYTFYFTVDVDLSDYASLPELDDDVIYNPSTNEIDVDLDDDGIMDIHFPREEYEGGSIVDCDIAFNQLYLDYYLPPEDPDDLTEQEQADMLGRTDIESYFMRALGEMLGISSIPLTKPVMGDWEEEGDYASNPWEKRELTMGDKMLGLLHYSDASPYDKSGRNNLSEQVDFGGYGGISGAVVDGQGYYGQGDVDTIVIPDIPVFLGIPGMIFTSLRIPFSPTAG